MGRNTKESKGRRVDVEASTRKSREREEPTEAALAASPAVLFLALPARLLFAIYTACLPPLRFQWRAHDRELRNATVRTFSPQGNPEERAQSYGATVLLLSILTVAVPTVLWGATLFGAMLILPGEPPAWFLHAGSLILMLIASPAAIAAVVALRRMWPARRDLYLWDQAGRPEEWPVRTSACPRTRDLAIGAVSYLAVTSFFTAAQFYG